MTVKLLLGLVILLTGFDESHAAPPEGGDQRQAVVAAADALLKKFWPSLQQDRASYGLAPGDALTELTFGEPVELHGVRDEKVRAYRPDQPLQDLAESTGHWFVPMVSKGTYRAMIEVLHQGDGQWRGAGIGWVPLAQKWQAINRRWPVGERRGPLLMIFFSQPGYYFSVPSIQPSNLTPLISLKLSGDGEVPAEFRPDDATRVMEALKTAVETQPAK